VAQKLSSDREFLAILRREMSDLEETRALASQTINETYQLLRLIEKLESPMIAPMPQNSPTEERTRGSSFREGRK
jgi:hypothetical protein